MFHNNNISSIPERELITSGNKLCGATIPNNRIHPNINRKAKYNMFSLHVIKDMNHDSR